MTKKSKIVQDGYNKIASQYSNQRHLYPNKSLLLRFMKHVPENSKILDLGCGSGIAISKFLSNNGFNVTGIDFSDAMLKLARKNVPRAKFIRMDMTKMEFKENSFDGAVSFYAIIHVPRQKHSGIYKRLHRILRHNAVMLVNAGGHKQWEQIADDYMGVPMFWSFYSPKKTLDIIKSAGFSILWSKNLKLGGETQFWVLARNNKTKKRNWNIIVNGEKSLTKNDAKIVKKAIAGFRKGFKFREFT